MRRADHWRAANYLSVGQTYLYDNRHATVGGTSTRRADTAQDNT